MVSERIARQRNDQFRSGISSPFEFGGGGGGAGPAGAPVPPQEDDMALRAFLNVVAASPDTPIPDADSLEFILKPTRLKSFPQGGTRGSAISRGFTRGSKSCMIAYTKNTEIRRT